MPPRADVNQWFRAYDNPMKDVVLAVREVILGTDPRVDECIKWQAPTFTFNGNIASFFPKSKKHASLMFHQGAKIPGRHTKLEGTGKTSRVMKFASIAEVRKNRSALEAVVRAWISWKEGGSLKKTAKKKTAKKTAKKKAAKRKTAKKKTAKKKTAKKKTAKKKTAR